MNRRHSLKLMAALGLLPVAGVHAWHQASMMKRNIPGSNEQLPIVGVGTWETFDVTASQRTLLNELKEVLKVLHEKGGSVIDSSPMYGFAEKNVGQLSAELSINKKLFLATKVWTQGRDQGVTQMNKSLELMRRSQIDLMQIHNLVDWPTHMKTLREWKDKAKARYIGITHYQTDAYAEMEKIMKTEPIDFIQVNYNVLDRDSANRLLPLAQEKKMGVIISQPFGYGKLFQRVKNKTLPTWSAEFDCHSWAQFFLKFILAHPAVTCVIPGTGNPVHMADNVGAGFGRLPDASHLTRMVKELA